MSSAKRMLAGLAMISTLFGGGAALAAEHEVRMLDRGEAGMMVFEPALLRIAPGDSVRFQPTNPSHNAESIPAMTPEGAAPFKGRMNQEVVVTFEQPGIYGYECKPHYGMGMVGLVVVGEGDAARANLQQAQAAAHPARARARFQKIFQALEN